MKTIDTLIEKQERNWMVWFDFDGCFTDLKHCIGEFALSFNEYCHSNN